MAETRDATAAAAGTAAAAATAAPEDCPVVVSISRDYGAEGHEVGKLLSVKLGIPLYDNELLVRAALRTGFTEDQLAAYDEKVQGRPLALLPYVPLGKDIDSDKLFTAMRQVILDLGLTRSCIIEGRLSDYILRGNPNLIKVLVTAPMADRVRIVSEKRGLSEREGRRLVHRKQREREEFYAHYSGGRWGLHTGKDLVVNRAEFGREGCADIIARAYEVKLGQAQGR